MTLPPTSMHAIMWCGDTPVEFTGHSAIDASDTSARRRAWSERWPASPKGRIESEPRGPSQLRGVRGVARIAPSQLQIVTICHGLKGFVLILPCFGSFAATSIPCGVREIFREELLRTVLRSRSRIRSLAFSCARGLMDLAPCSVS